MSWLPSNNESIKKGALCKCAARNFFSVFSPVLHYHRIRLAGVIPKGVRIFFIFTLKIMTEFLGLKEARVGFEPETFGL